MKKLTSEDTEGMKVSPNHRNFPAKGFHFGWTEDSSESIWEPRTRNTGESLSGQTAPRWITQTGKKDPTTERQEDVVDLGVNHLGVLVNHRTSQQVCVCMVELISLERSQRKQDLLRKKGDHDVTPGAINRIVKQSYPLSAREPVVKLSLSISKM